MKGEIQKKFNARAKILKALAHPTRLFIVEVLSKGEKCVCELTQMIGADVSTISKHLSLLKNSGILQDHKKGLQVHYSLKCKCALDFFKCVESVLKINAQEHASMIGRRKNV